MPPLSSPSAGPPQISFGPGQSRPKRPRACGMRPSRGGYRQVGHVDAPERGQRLPAAAYPQKSVARILARGQSSTDLIIPERTAPFGVRLVPPSDQGPQKATASVETRDSRLTSGRRPCKQEIDGLMGGGRGDHPPEEGASRHASPAIREPGGFLFAAGAYKRQRKSE